MSASRKPPSTPENDPPRAAAPPRPRWLERSSALLLLVAVSFAIAAAAPALLRSPSAEPAESASPRGTAPAGPDAPRATTWAADQPPRFDPDDKPRLTEIERMFPDGMWPGHAGRDRPEVPAGLPSKARPGRAVAPLALRDQPEAAAPVRGRIPAGETLLVIREREGWALVVHRGESDVHTGWVPRRDITMP